MIRFLLSFRPRVHEVYREPESNQIKLKMDSRLRGNDNGGFVLLEVLLAILILSVGVTAGLAAIGQCLHIAKRGEETVSGVYQMEKMLYELESGERNDLVFFGGPGEGYEIKSEEEITEYASFYKLETRLQANDMKLTLFVGGAQQ